MDKIVVYKFQMEAILSTLQTISRMHHSSTRETAIDRSIMQSIGYARNAISGNITAPSERLSDQRSQEVKDGQA